VNEKRAWIWGLTLIVGAVAARPAFAQASAGSVPRAEIEIAYDVANRVTNKGVTNTYMAGWHAGASYRINRIVNAMAAFSGDYDKRTGFTANIYTYAVGARFQSDATRRKARPFAQVLLGGGQDNGTGTGKINHYPVLLPGGGTDLSVSPRLNVRLLLDFPILMAYGDSLTGTRFSVGISFPLGKR
jgi:hypothetical protein